MGGEKNAEAADQSIDGTKQTTHPQQLSHDKPQEMMVLSIYRYSFCVYPLMILVILLVQEKRAAGAFCQQPRRSHTQSSSTMSAVHIQGYDEALQTINNCAETGQLSPALDEAVRFLEVNSYRIYPKIDPSHVEDLWEKAQGSWELTATTGSYKNRSFHPTPAFLPFSFALIDGSHFGNGIGLDKKRIGLAFLHHAHFHAAHRKMTVTHPDLYLGGHRISFPDFLRPMVLRMVESENPNDAVPPAAKSGQKKEEQQHKDVPRFVLIAASEKALIARGNQSGGLALWTRLSQDVRPAAYKEYPVETTDYHLLPQ